MGARCQFPGAMSHGQRGESPFFCAWHFRCSDPLEGERIIGNSRRWDGKPDTYLELRKSGSSEPIEDREAA